MRTALLFGALLCAGCGLFQKKSDATGNPCVDDPTNVILVMPKTARMKPGDRLTFTFEIRSARGSATAEASISPGTLEPAGSNAVWLTAPPLPGTYELVISRVGCPADTGTATITVDPLQSLGKAPGQQPVPSGVAWSPDGTTVAASGRGGVWLFRADGTFLDSAKLPHQGKTSVAWSPDGQRLAVGGDVEERTWLLKAPSLEPITRVGMARGSAGALFSRDGSELFLHEGDAVRAFSLTTGAMRVIGPVTQTTIPNDVIPRLQHGPLGSLLVTVPGELREVGTGRRMARWTRSTSLDGVAISPAGKWVMTSPGGLQLPFVGQPLTTQGTTAVGGAFFCSSLTRDGALLALGHTGSVSVYRDDGATLTGVGGATLMNAPGKVLDVAWSPDGSKLAVAGSSRLLTTTISPGASCPPSRIRALNLFCVRGGAAVGARGAARGAAGALALGDGEPRPRRWRADGPLRHQAAGARRVGARPRGLMTRLARSRGMRCESPRGVARARRVQQEPAPRPWEAPAHGQNSRPRGPRGL